MRVIERRRGARLLLEARQPLGIGGVLLRQNLDRHLAAQARVFAEIHLAHAARAEQLEDLVRAERFADQCSPKRG